MCPFFLFACSFFVRFVPAAYEDGVSTAVTDRPSPREISNAVFREHPFTVAELSISSMFGLWRARYLCSSLYVMPLAHIAFPIDMLRC
jgi:hypothetical protein